MVFFWKKKRLHIDKIVQQSQKAKKMDPKPAKDTLFLKLELQKVVWHARHFPLYSCSLIYLWSLNSYSNFPKITNCVQQA